MFTAKSLFITCLLFFFSLSSFAQWPYSGNHIYNDNTLNVGIGNGTAFTPSEKLTVLGNILTTNNFILDGSGTQNQIYFKQSGNIKTQLTSNFTDGTFSLFHQGSNKFIIEQAGNIGFGTSALQPIVSGAGLFSGQKPRMEVVTGYSTGAYSDLFTIRHYATGPTAETRQLGMILKLSGEQSTTESDKMGGLVLESLAPLTYSNQPNLNFVIGNQKRMTLTFNGNFGVGTENPLTKFSVVSAGSSTPSLLWQSSAGAPVASFFGENSAGNADMINGFASSASSSARPVYMIRRSRGTLSSPQAVQTGDYLGALIGSGYDGANFANRADISFIVDGAISPNYVPTAISFSNGDVTRVERMRISSNGKVGIGTQSPDEMLTVNGKVHTKEVKVDLNIPAPDYVFKASYKLRTLEEVNKYIQSNGHLPDVPSAQTMEQNGVNIGEMNMQLLKKVEELTLYLIEEQKKRHELENRLKKMELKLKKSSR
ncbi:tail fiber protein [Mucilaginibacter auburnensis]|uniref:Uncharacterized protein n=1 Tax=Mucilaginibacter auburnensis TaxID=1457233 RepID=A0A2H9VR90_9SPHI|nr:tail fiber protein [Mucilaginibacter auburnensis]PJJ83340.1 hypothetical protein CLV57_0320 [Mucilaginibacter auburnensis]